MLLYILDPYTHDRIAVIEEYETTVWTERFIVAGDFTIVLSQKNPNANLLRGGTILECEDSQYPMIVEGIEREDGSLTITGRTLETFFNEISLSEKDQGSGDGRAADYFREEGSPGHVLNYFVNLLLDSWDGLTIPGFFVSTTVLTIADDGSTVDGKVTEREQGHDLLVRLAQKFNVDIYMRRVEDTSSEFNGPGTYKFGFGSRVPVDRSKTNPDTGGDPLPSVRFSPQDDNLIDVKEVYDATSDVSVMMVRVPAHFTDMGNPGDLGAGIDNDKILYGYKPSVGDYAFIDSLAELGKPPFQIRIKEADSDRLTLDYLKDQIWRYYPGQTREFWPSLDETQRQDLLKQEMQRLAIAEFKKAQRLRGHVIDGEVVANTYKYGVDYKLGDKVDVTSDLTPNIPYTVNEKDVTEFIRSVDDSGYRAYPTLAPPTEAAHYTSGTHEYNEHPDSLYADHTFSINGLLPDDLDVLSPHKVKVKRGEIKQLVSIAQTGPTEGTCYVFFKVNGGIVTSSMLPVALADGDTITIDVGDHSAGTKNVSGHFTIRVKHPNK